MLATAGAGKRTSGPLRQRKAVQRDVALGSLSTKPLLRRQAKDTEELDHRAAVGES